jgi:flagellar FliL protein
MRMADDDAEDLDLDPSALGKIEEDPETKKKRRKKLGMILGAVLGSALLVGLTLGGMRYLKKRAHAPTTPMASMPEMETPETPAPEAPAPAEPASEEKAPPAEGTDEKNKESKTGVKKAYYYTIKPIFIVNILTSGRTKFLQIEVNLMARSEAVLKDLEENQLLIKNDLISLFSSKKFEDLNTPEGKEQLKKESIKVVQDILQRETGNTGIETVLFTSFVMQ